MYDLVIQKGRVIDPESKLDAICNLGISGGVIRAIKTDYIWRVNSSYFHT